MTPYDLKMTRTAGKQISSLPAKQKKTVLRFIEALAINPRPPGSKKIEGMIGLYSEQIENVRLIYKVEEREVLLLLVK